MTKYDIASRTHFTMTTGSRASTTGSHLSRARRRVALACALLVAVSLPMIAASPAGAVGAGKPSTAAAALGPATHVATDLPARFVQDWGSYNVFRSFILETPKSYKWGYKMVDDVRKLQCTATGSIYMQEIGKHGVYQFKQKWETKSPQSPSWLLNYKTAGYYYSNRFADDSYSRWGKFALPPGYLKFFAGGKYALWVKVVGIRDWAKDYTRHYSLGVVGCDEGSDWAPGRGGPGTIDYG